MKNGIFKEISGAQS